MVDGINIILLKRANYYQDVDTKKVSDKVEKYVLRYGEPIFLKDLNYLVIGDNEQTVPELIEAHRFFQVAQNAIFYGDSLYDVDLELTDNNIHKIANLGFVKGFVKNYVQDELEKFLATLIEGLSATGSQGKTITKIEYDETEQNFAVTFSDIKIDISQVNNLESILSGLINATGAEKNKTLTEIKYNDETKQFDVTFDLIQISTGQITGLTDLIKQTTVDKADTIKVTSSSSGNYYVVGISENDKDSDYKSLYYSSKNIPYFKADTGVLMGAAWNDFAEFRQCNAECGKVVCEIGNGKLMESFARLQAAPAVVSDTCGIVIGQQGDGYVPIAVAGRVLVYKNESEVYHAGDAVCADVGGKVSVMTREEIKEYPDRILGYVSEIPTYDIWNDRVKVNNRIWIKLK